MQRKNEISPIDAAQYLLDLQDNYQATIEVKLEALEGYSNPLLVIRCTAFDDFVGGELREVCRADATFPSFAYISFGGALLSCLMRLEAHMQAQVALRQLPRSSDE